MRPLRFVKKIYFGKELNFNPSVLRHYVDQQGRVDYIAWKKEQPQAMTRQANKTVKGQQC